MRKSIFVCVLAICFTRILLAGPSTQPSVLDTKVGDVNVAETALADVVNQLVDNGASNIYVNWKALEAAGITRATPVSVVVFDGTVGQAIKAISENIKGDKKNIIACADDDGVVYVSTADDVKKVAATEDLPSRGDAQAAAQTIEALDRVMPEVNFNSIASSDVIEFLNDITKLKIDANWDALETAGTSKSAPVTLRIKNLPLKRALRMLLADMGSGHDAKLDYVVDGDHILISTRDDLLKK